jgi:hypothetical protein
MLKTTDSFVYRTRLQVPRAFTTYAKPLLDSYDKDYQGGDEEPCCVVRTIF